MTGRVDARNLAEVVDQLALGVAVVERDRQVVWLNRAAEHVLVGDDGLQLNRGQLQASKRSEQADLNALLSRATKVTRHADSTTGGALRITRPSGEPPFQLLVSRIAVEEPLPSRAVVYISDPAMRPGIDTDALRRLFDLTFAEARLALLLLRDADLSRAAHELGITMNTARTHMKRLFGKTGTRKQSQLLKVLGGLTVARGA